ncbi:hypothetical protein K501DRAFT_273650 [Backusella circina FSU 941]|nr:hypothetical protein K501DRAFT_273650 [Backusella circina FSU 941]
MSVGVITPTSTENTAEMHDFIMINKQEEEEKIGQKDDKEDNIDISKEEEPKESQEEEQEQVENSANQDLLEALRTELDQERATVDALQKQKQAITKDLDYLSITIDELHEEKNEIIAQLEQEKLKNQNQLEDMKLLLEKIKTTADDARDKAFAVDQTKLELKVVVVLLTSLLKKAELKKSQEQTTSLQSTIDRLEKVHNDEIDKLEKQCNTMHIPPRTTNNSATTGATSSTFNSRIATTNRLKRKETNLETVNLDDQLLKLTKEKEKIPLTGGGPQSRKRREELENMLDQVDSQLSKVKQKIKRS